MAAHLTAQGLTSAEVAERVQRGETNRFKARGGRTYVQIIRENVFNLFNIILTVLLFVVLLQGDYATVVFAGFSVFWNSVLGMFQEINAKRKLDQLAALAAHDVQVWRDGKLTHIPIAEIVKDDVLPIAPGDRMVVDGRVLSSDALEMDESQLTGESDAVLKEADDQIHSGSFCIAGTGVMVATRVGKDSAINKLSTVAKTYRRVLTPTQQKLAAIVQMSVIVMAICTPMIFISGYLNTNMLVPELETFRNAVVFVTSLVPQGLVLTAILALTIGAISISRHQTLVQRVNAVESMANVTTLCFDKTGTLTRNQLRVIDIESLNGEDVEDTRSRLSLYVNNLGHLNRTAAAVALFTNDIEDTLPPAIVKTREVPFNSARKWGAIVFENETLVLGAPERVLATHEKVAARARDLARHGYRVLAFARVPQAMQDGRLDGTREPLALVVLNDQVREDIQTTLDAFREQDVQLKVISGDNLETVKAISGEAGMAVDQAYTGDALEKMSEEEFEGAVVHGTIFARIEPETKRRIIATLQARGEYVAMVGDGVNDVPALKEANLAVVMNDGAQIAKDVADIVLLNNAMSTLPRAFHEGRAITQSIFATVKIFLVKNIYSTLFFIFAGFMSTPFPISPIQISWVTFGIINIPAGLIAIRVLKPEYMKRFRADVLDYVLVGGAVGAAAMSLLYAVSYLTNGGDVWRSRSTIMIFIAFYGLLVLWNVHGLFITRFSTVMPRPRLFLGGIAIATLTIAAPYFVPDLLEFVPPSRLEWGLTIVIFLVAAVLVEVIIHRRDPLKGLWLLSRP
ncbi:MAG: cation-translocating P-type ATPase [Anaerolineae bacterium]|nr:cation-translocating P-type ATPase [Anaerolineae bacterium]